MKKKEYIAPVVEIVTVLSDAAILAVSSPVLEDFEVSDGEW